MRTSFSFTFSTAADCVGKILKTAFEPMFSKITLREKCPNTEFFLVHIFLYSYWIRRFTIKPRLSCDRSFIPLGSWKLNMLLRDSLMNFRIPFFKEFRLFDLFILFNYCLRKKSIFERIVFQIYPWNFVALPCSVWHIVYTSNWIKVLRRLWFYYFLEIKKSFLYQGRWWKVSKPNSW